MTTASGRPRLDAGRATTQVVVAIIVLSGLIFVMYGRSLLPGRFDYDSLKIAAIASSDQGYAPDRSFEVVGLAYRALGIVDAPLAAGIFGFGLFVVVLALAVFRRLRNADTLAIALICGSVLLAAVYLGTFSKDVFVLPVVAMALLRRKGVVPELLLIAAMSVYAWGFRSYWWLVVAGYVAFRIISVRRFSVARMLVFSLLALVVLSIAFRYYLGVDLDYYRSAVNAGRAGAVDARTAIQPFVGLPEPIDGLVNSALVLASFIFPLPLLLKLDPYYGVVAVFLILLWFTFATAVKRLTAVEGEVDPRMLRLVALVLSLTVVQSVFEPDYGSYLRHLTPILPALLAVVLSPQAVKSVPAAPEVARAR